MCAQYKTAKQKCWSVGSVRNTNNKNHSQRLFAISLTV